MSDLLEALRLTDKEIDAAVHAPSVPWQTEARWRAAADAQYRKLLRGLVLAEGSPWFRLADRWRPNFDRLNVPDDNLCDIHITFGQVRYAREVVAAARKAVGDE